MFTFFISPSFVSAKSYFEKERSIVRKGEIVYRNIQSAMFIVRLNDQENNCSIFEGFNVQDFSVGDKVFGALARTGTAEVVNATAFQIHMVIIRYVNCTYDMAMDLVNDL